MRDDWSTLRKLMFQRMAAGGRLIEDTVTGNPAVFQTNVAKPLTGFTIPFLPVQSGTGDPSPDNVRPIIGWSGVTAFHGADQTEYDSYPITFPATVYGGTAYPLDGVLSVEWVSLTRTWDNFGNKTSLGDNTRGTLNISSYPSKPSSMAVDAKCNIAPRNAGWSTDSIHFYTNEGSCVVFLPNDTDASTEIQVVYPLDTPIEIQLDPLSISTLIGDNTIWTDTNGENTIRYKKKG